MTTDTATTARACLAQIRPGALEYDEWLAVGMAAKDAGLLFAEWDAWSRGDKRYKPKEMQAKWNSFRGNSTHAVGVGSLVKLCRDQGGRIDTAPAIEHGGRELDWNDTIGGHEAERPALQVVRQEWLEDQALPTEPNGTWDGRADFAEYLRVLFSSDERVGIVAEAWEQNTPDGSKRWLPKKGVSDRTAGELLETLAAANDLGEVIGDWPKAVGAWIRFNPLDGKGVSDENVTAMRFALVESDDISVERQYAIYRQLELPIAALVHSGGKSLHAIVRIEAPDFKEYQKRVDFLYDVCKKNGLVIDRKNRNPSRLSRLPGVTRDGRKQWLVATNIGKQTWAEWSDWIAAVNDDLPEIETLADYIANPPPLGEPLISDLLRCAHKMMLTGAANSGKSFLLLNLAISIAEGRDWLGFKCKKGRVLYVNLELDRASAINRLAMVYQAMGIPPDNAAEIDVWNLRGRSMPMTELAPRLIRRALKRKYAAVIIDPIYKVLCGDENAADQMAKFCNLFDRVCLDLGAATIHCHHHSKGEQGQKNAADRSSGSGVFKRDPDALLDMIELVIPDALRKQISNRWECDAMALAFDTARPDWREKCPQDDTVVAAKLARWAEAEGMGEIMRPPRSAAARDAEETIALRIECGTCREFRRFKPRNVFFKYPLHHLDTWGLLDDARAEGEEPQRRNPKEAGQAKADRTNAETRNAVDACRDAAGNVFLAGVVEYLGLSERGVRDRLKNAGYAIKKGQVSENAEIAEDN
jgi:hypothetical protein